MTYEEQTDLNESFRETAANIMAEYTDESFLDLTEYSFEGE